MMAQKASPAERLELTKIERGSTLLNAHSARLANIRSMIGVPQQHWRLLYQPLFVAFAELVQSLPVSGGAQQHEYGDSLQCALGRVGLALKLRRGRVLPPAKEPEAVAEEQDVWTYAVVTAAMLHDVGATLTGQCVTLYGRDQLPLAVWSPWVGPMTQARAKRYRTEFRRSDNNELHGAVTPLIVNHVVPSDGLRWLGCHQDALAAWLTAISGHSVGSAIIADIVGQADQIASGRDGSDTPRQLAIPGVETWAEPSVPYSDGSEAETTRVPVHKSDVAQQDAASITAALTATDNVEFGVRRVQTDNREAKQVDGDEENEDPGAAFIAWLIKGISSDALALNTPKARAHVVHEGLLLVSPAVFQAFAGDQWRDVQKHFLKQKLNDKTAAGGNFFHYVLETDGGTKMIKGIVIRNPEAKLAVTLPPRNQTLSRKTDAD